MSWWRNSEDEDDPWSDEEHLREFHESLDDVRNGQYDGEPSWSSDEDRATDMRELERRSNRTASEEELRPRYHSPQQRRDPPQAQQVQAGNKQKEGDEPTQTMPRQQQDETIQPKHEKEQDEEQQVTAHAQQQQLSKELFVFTNAKAGMSAVDKERVQQVVYNMSKDSEFFQNSLRKNDKVEDRIRDMQKKLTLLSSAQRELLQRNIDKRIAKLESERSLERTKVVVDMDMFYAAVEMRDDPKLRDVPLAVGGLSMISTTNYVARQFGVRAAMPGFIGKELCPELVFVEPNYVKYKAVAEQIRSVFREYDPDFSAFSLDEASLDITEYMDAHWHRYDSERDESDPDNDAELVDIVGCSEADGEAAKSGVRKVESLPVARRVAIASAIVEEMRRKVFENTKLTASAGIACNTMLAKICSDMNKPNGQYVLPFTRQDVMTFVQELPVRKIGGVGKVMEKQLAALGVMTGKDMFEHRVAIFHVFSGKTAPWLLRTSLGIQEYREPTVRKSYSRERTFRKLSDPKQLKQKCRQICEMLAQDLAKATTGAKNITLKLKSTNFSVITRSISVPTVVSTADALFAVAVELLKNELPLELRLMGVRASALVDLKSGAGSDGGPAKKQLAIESFARKDQRSSSAHSASVAGSLKADTKRRKRPMDAFVASEQQHQGDKESSSENREQVEDVVDTFHPCPICGTMLNSGNIIAVNTHIDACIQGNGAPAHKKKKGNQHSLHSFFRPNRVIRPR